jgi:putative transposase
VLGSRHLLRLLADYEVHYNSNRPHRGIDLVPPQTIDFGSEHVPACEIVRTGAVAGLINEYHGRTA